MPCTVQSLARMSRLTCTFSALIWAEVFSSMQTLVWPLRCVLRGASQWSIHASNQGCVPGCKCSYCICAAVWLNPHSNEMLIAGRRAIWRRFRGLCGTALWYSTRFSEFRSILLPRPSEGMLQDGGCGNQYGRTYDYKALADVVDFLVVMDYDSNDPRAAAPSRVRALLDVCFFFLFFFGGCIYTGA